MFFIVNKTKQRIVLGDLGVSLGPRQAIDLDKIVKRERSEKSGHLILAKNKGEIEIRIKDSDAKKVIPNTPTDSNADLNKMKDDIVSELRGSIQQLAQQISASKPGSSNVVLSDEDVRNLTQQIMDKIPSERKSDSDTLKEEDIEMDGNVVSDINARAVNKMVKNTDISGIKYKEEKLDSKILGDMKELEKLLD
jgi:hypothetical protein